MIVGAESDYDVSHLKRMRSKENGHNKESQEPLKKNSSSIESTAFMSNAIEIHYEKNLDQLEQILQEYFEKLQVEPETSASKYKLTAEIVETEFKLKIMLKLYKLKTNNLCIHVLKADGDQLKFNKWFQEFKKNIETN